MVYGGGFCVVTGKVMILFLVLASHLKYMAANLFSVWPGQVAKYEDLESEPLLSRDRTTFIHYQE